MEEADRKVEVARCDGPGDMAVIDRLKAALRRYGCDCPKPCALYDVEKERADFMPHMLCGWWARDALGEDKG